MRFVIERDILVEALGRVVGTVERRTAVPILANVFIDARARDVSLRATDLNIEVTVPCPAEVTAQGVTTVNAEVLANIVRKCPSGSQLAVTLDGGNVRIVCGRAKYQLPTLPADDFPQLSGVERGANFEMTSTELRALFEATRFAISTDETRYYLNGIYLHADGEHLAAVATDGHVLSRKSVTLPPQAHGIPGVIVPRKTVAELLKFLPEREVNIEVSVSSARIAVRLGGAEMVSKLIDGTFPDYKRVIPSDHSGRAIVPRLALIAVVERVALIAEEKGKGIALTFGADELRVSVDNPERGSARDAVAECAYDGAPVTVGFNWRYLLDELRASGSDQIAMLLIGVDGPVRIEEVDGDGSHVMVIMPMRVRDVLAQAEREVA